MMERLRGTFQDETGRTWGTRIDVGTIRRVRERCGFDLAGEFLSTVEKLDNDITVMCDVLYVVVEPQARVMNPPVTDTDFGRLLFGDVIYHAGRALLESLTDFTPSPHRRAQMAKIMKTAEAMVEAEEAKKTVEMDAVLQSMTTAEGRTSSSRNTPEYSA